MRRRADATRAAQQRVRGEAGAAVEHRDRVRERRRDPNGQVFDLTSSAYARDVWRIAV